MKIKFSRFDPQEALSLACVTKSYYGKLSTINIMRNFDSKRAEVLEDIIFKNSNEADTTNYFMYGRIIRLMLLPHTYSKYIDVFDEEPILKKDTTHITHIFSLDVELVIEHIGTNGEISFVETLAEARIDISDEDNCIEIHNSFFKNCVVSETADRELSMLLNNANTQIIDEADYDECFKDVQKEIKDRFEKIKEISKTL